MLGGLAVMLVQQFERKGWPTSGSVELRVTGGELLVAYLRSWSLVGWGPKAFRYSDGSWWVCGTFSSRSCDRARRAASRRSRPPTPCRSRQIFTVNSHWPLAYYRSMWFRNRKRTCCGLLVSLRDRVTCLRRISRRLPFTANHH